MRRLLLLALAALLVLPALPAAAEAATCDVLDGEGVLTPDSTTETTIETPTFLGSGTTTLTYVVDLGELPDGEAPTVTVGVAMTWGIAANDYDLGVNGTLSEGYQPFDAVEEFVSVARIGQCGLVEIEAINYLAPVDLDTLELVITVSKLK